MILETSSDVLLITLSVCAMALTIFICYALLSLTKILNNFEETVKNINNKLKKADEALDAIVPTIKSVTKTANDINEKIKRMMLNFSIFISGLKKGLNKKIEQYIKSKK